MPALHFSHLPISSLFNQESCIKYSLCSRGLFKHLEYNSEQKLSKILPHVAYKSIRCRQTTYISRLIDTLEQDVTGSVVGV